MNVIFPPLIRYQSLEVIDRWGNCPPHPPFNSKDTILYYYAETFENLLMHFIDLSVAAFVCYGGGGMPFHLFFAIKVDIVHNWLRPICTPITSIGCRFVPFLLSLSVFIILIIAAYLHWLQWVSWGLSALIDSSEFDVVILMCFYWNRECCIVDVRGSCASEPNNNSIKYLTFCQVVLWLLDRS